MFPHPALGHGDPVPEYEAIFVGDGVACKKLKRLPQAIDVTLVADHPLVGALHDWRIKAIRLEPDARSWLAVRDCRLCEHDPNLCEQDPNLLQGVEQAGKHGVHYTRTH